MSDIESQFRLRRDSILAPLASRLEEHLKEHFRASPRIDRIAARAKAVDRFVAKASKVVDGKPKYPDPFSQIQDQIGARVIAFYLQDVDVLSASVEKYFRRIESQQIVPDSEAEFGYFGKHYILFIPTELQDGTVPTEQQPKFFELQVKTLFQHAWAEANHDLAYKPTDGLSSDQKRRIAFTAAQSWGADQIFGELFSQLAKPDGHDAA